MRNRPNDQHDDNEQSDINEEFSIRYIMHLSESDDKKDTVDYDVDKEKGTSSLISDDKKEESLKLKSHVEELLKDKKNCVKTKDQNNIPKYISSNDGTKSMEKYTDDKVKQRLKARIQKELSHNTNATKNSSHSHGKTSELVEGMLNHSDKYLPEELTEKITSISKKIDSVADMKRYIKAPHHQRDHDGIYDDTLRDFSGYEMDDNEKLKSVIETIQNPKHLRDPVDSSYTTVIVLNGDSGESLEVNTNPEDQADGQGDEASNQTDVTSQEVQGNAQAVGFAEGDGSQACHQGHVDLEEGVEDLKELAMQHTTRQSKIPEKSALVTGLRCLHLTEDHHTQVKSQFQELVRMFNAGDISVQAIVKLVAVSIGCVATWHYYISELLSPIVDVVNNAEEVLLIRSILNTLRTFILQVLRMPQFTTDAEPAVSFPTHNGPRTVLETFGTQLINQLRQIDRSRTLLDDNDNNSQVTCASVQDTDVDDCLPEGFFNSDVARCFDNEAEVLELLGCQCQLCTVLMHQRKYLVEQILSNTRCYSSLNDELLSRLATLVVSVNAHSPCHFKTLQLHLPFDALQRNLTYVCQNLQSVVESTLIPDPTNLRRVFHSIANGLSINCNHLKSSKCPVVQLIPTFEHDVPLITSEHAQRLHCITSLQHCVDRLCNQFKNLFSNDLYQSFVSMLQPFVLGAVVSKDIPSYMDSVQRCLSRLQSYFYYLLRSYVNSLPNTIMPKISISVSVISSDVPITIDQLNEFLGNCLASRRKDCHITRLLGLPPADIINNEPMMIVANFMFTFPSTLFIQAGFDINPVDAVDLHSRESLVMAVEASYSHHDNEKSSNSVEQSDVSFSDSSPNPNNSHKKVGYFDIHEHHLAENGPYVYCPPVNTDRSNSTNSIEVNHASVEATISDNSSQSDSQA